MKRILITLLVVIIAQFNCGTLTAQTIRSVGDFPIVNTQKGVWYV